MQLLMVMRAKVIRVFYAILTKGVAYEPTKMLSDIKCSSVYLQLAEKKCNNERDYKVSSLC